MPTPYYLDYYRFVVSFETRTCEPPSLSGFPVIPCDFEDQVIDLCKRVSCDFDKNCTELLLEGFGVWLILASFNELTSVTLGRVCEGLIFILLSMSGIIPQ